MTDQTELERLRDAADAAWDAVFAQARAAEAAWVAPLDAAWAARTAARVAWAEAKKELDTERTQWNCGLNED